MPCFWLSINKSLSCYCLRLVFEDALIVIKYKCIPILLLTCKSLEPWRLQEILSPTTVTLYDLDEIFIDDVLIFIQNIGGTSPCTGRPIHDDRLPSRSWWYWDAGTPSEPWRTCETFSVQHILKLTWICLIGKDTQYVSLCLVFNYWNQLLIKLLYPCYLVSPI